MEYVKDFVTHPVFLVFFSAFTLSTVSCVTEHYSENVWVSFRSQWLYGYGLFIGLIGVMLYMGMGALRIKLELQEDWARAIVVGLGTKTFLSFDVFSWKIGTSKIPFGLKVILHILEMTFLRKVSLHHIESKFDFAQNQGAKIDEKHLPKLKTFMIKMMDQNFTMMFIGIEKQHLVMLIRQSKTVEDVINVLHGQCGAKFAKSFLDRFKKENGIR